jgi:hypothetical protein
MAKKDHRFDIKSILSYYLFLLPFIFVCILVARRSVQKRLFASVLFLDTHLILWRIDKRDNNRCYVTRLYNNRVTVGNGVMQPVTRQLQQLDYRNGNGDVFYVARAEELS